MDRRQVWNQKRPPWYEAILHLVYPVLDPIVHMLVVAVQTGATNYQAMSLAISCLSEMWDCIPDCLYTVASALSEILSTDIKPLGSSVLIQILFSALYTKLVEATKLDGGGGAEAESAAETSANKSSTAAAETSANKSSICNILAEAICSIDEDNKHTDAIGALIQQARDSQRPFSDSAVADIDGDVAGGLSLVSILRTEDNFNTFNRVMCPLQLFHGRWTTLMRLRQAPERPKNMTLKMLIILLSYCAVMC